MRIGITGYAESGKDEVADVLVQEFGFVKVNMSDALHRYMMILNPIISSGREEPFGGEYVGIRYGRAVERFGYTNTKKFFPEARRLLQVFGTEIGRAIDPNLWVRELDKVAAEHDNVVTTGVRFPNEAAPMDVLIYVDRPGVGPVNSHASDDLTDIFPLVNIIIVNDGTLDDLRDQTVAALGAWQKRWDVT